MRVPRSASPDARVLADVIGDIGRKAGGRRPGRHRGAQVVRAGGWRLVDEGGALTAVHDGGARAVLAVLPPAGGVV
jgi:hypothetical protein